MWMHHLYSACIRDNRQESQGRGVAEVKTLTKETRVDDNYELIKEIIKRPSVVHADPFNNPNRTAVFVRDCGDRYYVGLDGLVEEVLGKDHRYAFERTIGVGNVEKKGRPIPFTHGFFAKKGASIPELDELIAAQKTHLLDILHRANEGEYPVEIPELEFTQPRKAGTKWDEIAQEIEGGKHEGKFAIFSREGELVEWWPAKAKVKEPEALTVKPVTETPPKPTAQAEQPTASPPPEQPAQPKPPEPAPAAAPAEKAERSFFKKMLYTEEGTKLHFGKVTAVSAAVLAVGAGAYYLFKPKNNKADTWAGKEDARRQGGLAQAGQQM